MTAYEKLYQSMKRFVSSMRELAKTAGNEGVHMSVTLTCTHLYSMSCALVGGGRGGGGERGGGRERGGERGGVREGRARERESFGS